jgi:hypothetical protein
MVLGGRSFSSDNLGAQNRASAPEGTLFRLKLHSGDEEDTFLQFPPTVYLYSTVTDFARFRG